jgi:osmoprotectant transport system permease protein
MLFVFLLPASLVGAETIIVGSKNFTENYILSEISAQLLEHNGFDVDRRQGMNGTKVAFEALRTRAIDLYPEYSGTITEVILLQPELAEFEEIQAALSERQLQILPPLGFNNTYAMAVSQELSAQLSLIKISDLKAHAKLRVALPHEFLNRNDGWQGLKARYGLSHTANGIEHALAYEAMRQKQIDVTAAYSTDGEIIRSGMVLLEDDLQYFPQYLATFLIHDGLPIRARELMETLGGRIDDRRMQELNLSALDPDNSIIEVASRFLIEEGLTPSGSSGPTVLSQLLRNTQRHLKLTGIALLLAVIAGVGIAVSVYRHPALSRAFLTVSGLLQTVPSIALLALLIPLVGIGQTPAIIALFLYSLLPIARSTITAMLAIPHGYRQVAAAMAMTRRQELRYVLLPLAMPHVIAGIRTAAVICIGTATLAAFIGAGGLGDPIVTGLALNDTSLILQGAIPAAFLAIGTEILFGGIERLLVVPHMRSSSR